MGSNDGVIKSVRFKNEEEAIAFKKHLKKRNISSTVNFIRESIALYERTESPLDTLNKEILYLRKNIKYVEKKVDVSTEISRSLLLAFVNYLEGYCEFNKIGFEEDSLNIIERDIIMKVQNGLSWSEKVLSPMGLDKE